MLEFRDVVVLKVGIEGQWWNNNIVNIVWLNIYIVKISKINEIYVNLKKMFTKMSGKQLLFWLSDTLNSVAREDVPTQIIQMFLVLQVS